MENEKGSSRRSGECRNWGKEEKKQLLKRSKKSLRSPPIEGGAGRGREEASMMGVLKEWLEECNKKMGKDGGEPKRNSDKKGRNGEKEGDVEGRKG